jgi:hypothetical protein
VHEDDIQNNVTAMDEALLNSSSQELPQAVKSAPASYLLRQPQ